VGAEKAHLTTEELEMAKIKAMRKDLEQKRKMAEESHKQAKVSHSYVPKHSAVKPTQPFEFKFKTDERIKDHGMETRQDKEIKDFTSQLRHNSPPHTQVI
jgi:targeting protein for Xklp2